MTLSAADEHHLGRLCCTGEQMWENHVWCTASGRTPVVERETNSLGSLFCRPFSSTGNFCTHIPLDYCDRSCGLPEMAVILSDSVPRESQGNANTLHSLAGVNVRHIPMHPQLMSETKVQYMLNACLPHPHRRYFSTLSASFEKSRTEAVACFLETVCHSLAGPFSTGNCGLVSSYSRFCSPHSQQRGSIGPFLELCLPSAGSD